MDSNKQEKEVDPDEYDYFNDDFEPDEEEEVA